MWIGRISYSWATYKTRGHWSERGVGQMTTTSYAGWGKGARKVNHVVLSDGRKCCLSTEQCFGLSIFELWLLVLNFLIFLINLKSWCENWLAFLLLNYRYAFRLATLRLSSDYWADSIEWVKLCFAFIKTSVIIKIQRSSKRSSWKKVSEHQ